MRAGAGGRGGGQRKKAQEARRVPRRPLPGPRGWPLGQEGSGRSARCGAPRGPTCPAGRSSWWCGSCGLCSRPCRRSRAPPPSPPAGAAPAGASSRARPALPHAAPGRRGGPGSAAPAGRAQPGRPPRHHDGGGGWRPRTGGPSGGRRGWRRGPCGPAAPARRSRAPGLPRSGSRAPGLPRSRRRPLTLPCAPAAARCGPGDAPGRRGRASRAPPPAPRRPLPAARSPPPPPPPPGRAPEPSPPRRSAPARPPARRLRPPPGAARAVQVTALPRKREAERRAPGLPGPLPAPGAARADPRTRDAPPRGTVRTARSPGSGKAAPPLTWARDSAGAPGGASKTRSPLLPSAPGSPPRA
ncbi:unnamed protein product [Nyctereutes procyonoides]|uniref:(raccoon dog) hypothetical protein n=1 Tax=Nyctereutes procyonoides TaxID=34880 RepID=A0A811YE75_NYCPR|nr:unnamed protein product [Nyctereutes procyonoides]